MAVSLGKVTTAPGTPIRATANRSDPTDAFLCHGYMIQQLDGQTGNIYVGDRATMDKSTLEGVIAVLPPPTANSFPTFSETVSYSPAGINLANIWLDFEEADEAALVSAVVP